MKDLRKRYGRDYHLFLFFLNQKLAAHKGKGRSVIRRDEKNFFFLFAFSDDLLMSFRDATKNNP